MDLSSLQRHFAQALADPRRDLPPGLLAAIRSDRLAAGDRMRVYQANALGALTRALERTYPVCRQILGERCFAQLARDYALTATATDPDLDNYGQGFTAFLGAAGENRAELHEYPYLSDLGRLEWAVKQAWLAPDAPAFDFAGFQDSLARVPAEQHRLTASPSLAVIQSEWPIDRLWSLHRSGAAPKELQAEDTIRVGVWRGPDGVLTERLAAPDERLLSELLAGASLARLGRLATDCSLDLASALPRFISKGWICGYAVSEATRI